MKRSILAFEEKHHELTTRYERTQHQAQVNKYTQKNKIDDTIF